MPKYLSGANYTLANGGCYRCSRGDRLIDMDAQIVGEGTLAICVGCLTDAAESAKLTFNRAYVTELEARIRKLSDESRPVEMVSMPRDVYDAMLYAAGAKPDPEPPSEPVDTDVPVRCTAIKKDGTQCKGTATADTDTCTFHKPEDAAAE